MTTAIAPNVADRMRPKWWNVSDFHSGFSTTALRQCLLRQCHVDLLTRLVFQGIALAFCSPLKVRKRVVVPSTCP